MGRADRGERGSRARVRRRRLDRGARVDAIRELFDTDCDVFFVFTGTAANSLGLAAMCRNTDAIICHAIAHINVDECGAPEFFSGGAKLAHRRHAAAQADAGGDRAARGHAARRALRRGRARVALTQATELGTLYTPLEMWHAVPSARTRAA